MNKRKVFFCIKFLLFIYSLLIFVNAAAQERAVNITESGPIVVKTGFYLTNLYDINLPQKSFKVVGYMWWDFKPENADYLPVQSTDTVNAKEEKWQQERLHKPKPGYYEAKLTATIIQEWNLRNFPFDKHRLQIFFEDSGYSLKHLEYVADSQYSGVKPELYSDDWEITGSSVGTAVDHYYGNYNHLKLKEDPYSRFVFTVDIKRHNGGWLFFYSFIGSFVAAILCILGFFTRLDSELRFNLFLGAVFAVVANQYLLYNMIPMTMYLTLGDKVQIATFILLVSTIILDIVLNRIAENRQRKMGNRMNNWIGSAMGISYIAYIAYVVRLAIVS